MQVARPSSLCVVPYVLKLLAEQADGIEALKRTDSVVYTGSRCPDDLGDLLTDHGINIGTIIGT